MRRLGWLLILVLVLAGAGCEPFEPQRTQGSPSPAPSILPKTRDEMGTPVRLVGVSLWVQGQAAVQPELVEGSQAQVMATFSPLIVQEQRSPDGSLLSTNWSPWRDHPVSEMRVCFAAGQACVPAGPWQAFQDEASFTLPVDWLGQKTFFLAAEFRAANGGSIPAAGMDSLQPQAVAQVQLDTLARADPNPPAGQTPNPQVQTAQAATRSAFPVSGSVLIEEGRCCAGGVAGSEVQLSVAFTASSPAGAVSEMRVQAGGSCLHDAVALEAPWGPFAPQRTITTRLAQNWVGFYVNVQFRDAQGNLSPVYCDDISLEGSPARTP
jgi:hypothetical protein